MVNLGNPYVAFKHSFLPVDGVGLVRMEFIITEMIKIHPMAIIHPELLTTQKDQEHMKVAMRNYEDLKEFFITTLAEGVATIAAAFYPRRVIVRFSDFKSNEYASLVGGHVFEQHEENPMLVRRGYIVLLLMLQLILQLILRLLLRLLLLLLLLLLRLLLLLLLPLLTMPILIASV